MSLESSVAIDGPAGAGKSTVARALSAMLGMRYVSTGELYRALALAVLRNGADPEDEQAVGEVARGVTIDVAPDQATGQRVFLNGEDVTGLIRGADVDRIVSVVSVYPAVRADMVRQQRRIAEQCDVVMDGRDIGTVVLAESRHKFFLTASPEERARRRMLDYTRMGESRDHAEVIREILERDRIDSERSVSPLRPAEDAVIIDSTLMTVDEVVTRICELIGDAVPRPGGRVGTCYTGSSNSS
ncbi:MAG: (d)CMP kinase [Firmicutes bacterium]|nr:(d)CMP kinase [Bacillota bacterium]